MTRSPTNQDDEQVPAYKKTRPSYPDNAVRITDQRWSREFGDAINLSVVAFLHNTEQCIPAQQFYLSIKL